MSLMDRFTSALFTAIPGGLFFIATLASASMMAREHFWSSIFLGALTLLGAALLFGFVIPPMFRSTGLGISAAGFAAMLFSLLVIALLNSTPLCVGQNNGDGNNSFGMCMAYVVLYSIFYGIPYMALLGLSALIGHWALRIRS
ncbi:MAG TPA: hypothetical protein PK078_11930 [Anaerolineales bacterium]|nr:hypothetical protein [Anaerolineales bacterium]